MYATAEINAYAVSAANTTLTEHLYAYKVFVMHTIPDATYGQDMDKMEGCACLVSYQYVRMCAESSYIGRCQLTCIIASEVMGL